MVGYSRRSREGRYPLRAGERGDKAMFGIVRISKRAFYLKGGFSNPALFRKADGRGTWSYWEMVSV